MHQGRRLDNVVFLVSIPSGKLRHVLGGGGGDSHDGGNRWIERQVDNCYRCAWQEVRVDGDGCTVVSVSGWMEGSSC